MKPFHPPLVACYPVVSLYAANLSLIPWQDTVVPCLFAAVFSLIAWGIAWLLLRDVHRSAIAASILSFSFFLFGPLQTALKLTAETYFSSNTYLFVLTVWLLIVAVALFALCRKWRDLPRVTLVLNVASSLLLVFSIGTVVLSVRSPEATHAKLFSAESEGADTPDVFFIVLDGYARGDVLEEFYGEPATLERGLEELGFFVAQDARANYIQTQLSLAATLNMEYLDDVERDGNADTERLRLDALIDHSLVQQTFEAMGYTTVAVTTGFPAITFSHAAVRIGRPLGGSLFRNALLERTPIRQSDTVTSEQYKEHRNLVLGAFENLAHLAKPTKQPRFIVVHVLAPHPPFVFGRKGEPVRPEGAYSIVDGSHFHERYTSQDNYTRGYAEQASFIADQTLDAVRMIASAQEDAIIILQSDHGPKSKLDQESPERTDVDECLPILFAVKGPVDYSQGATPVNTFRNLFSQVFGLDFPTLEDRSYYSPWSAPLDFTPLLR